MTDVENSNFNPRSPQGERPQGTRIPYIPPHFNPRSPQGERRLWHIAGYNQNHFNPRSPHGERPDAVDGVLHGVISIHAPRKGSDVYVKSKFRRNKNFNPRSPQGERRKTIPGHHTPKDFNPRSPQGERLSLHTKTHLPSYFNPRSPQGERPVHGRGVLCLELHFNPRSPQGERPGLDNENAKITLISIHAPRKGSDYCCTQCTAAEKRFQSTLPARGATIRFFFCHNNSSYFNPRSPQGERPFTLLCGFPGEYFNPRSPQGERHKCGRPHLAQSNFNPRSPQGERRIPSAPGC